MKVIAQQKNQYKQYLNEFMKDHKLVKNQYLINIKDLIEGKEIWTVKGINREKLYEKNEERKSKNKLWGN